MASVCSNIAELSHAPFSLHSGLLRRPFSVEFLLFLQAEPAKTAKNISFVSAVGAKSAEHGKALQHRGATNNGLQDEKCLGRYMAPGILHQTGKPVNFSANSN